MPYILKKAERSCFLLLLSSLFLLPAYPDQVEVIKDAVNLRADSTITSLPLGHLNKGERLDVLRKKFEWLKVILPKKFHAYLAAKYIREVNPGLGEVTASRLNLRSKPSLNSPVLGQLKNKNLVTLIEKNNGWYKVDAYPHLSGWIHAKFVQKVAVLPQPPRTQLLDKIISQLDKGEITDKATLHVQLIKMGKEVIPQLESYFSSAGQNTIYSLIYVIGKIAEKNQELALSFLAKADPAAPILAGIYLDLAQDALGAPETKPYFYLANQGKLTPGKIKKAKSYLKNIYQKKIQAENK